MRWLMAAVVVTVGCGKDSSPLIRDDAAVWPGVHDSSMAAYGLVVHGCGDAAIDGYTFPVDLHLGETAVARFDIDVPWITQVTASGSGLEGTGTSVGVVYASLRPLATGPFSGTLQIKASPPRGEARYATLAIHANVLPALDPHAQMISAAIVSKQAPDVVTLTNPLPSTVIDVNDVTTVSDDGLPPLELVPGFVGALQPGESVPAGGTGRVLSPGCRHTTTTFQSDGGTVSLVYEQFSPFRIDLTATGGTITSVPANPCPGGQCDLTPITLTATPAPGMRFIGWTTDTGCTTSPTCTIVPVANRSFSGASARFAPASSPTIALTMQGQGRVVFTEGNGPSIACEGSCNYAPSDPTALVTADVVSVTPFAGWSGFCSGTLQHCNIGAQGSSIATTATFTTDDRSVATLFPPVLGLGIDTYHRNRAELLPGGDRVTSAGWRLSRITPAGVTVWSRPVATLDLAVTGSGEIIHAYGIATKQIVEKLDGAGTVQWTRDIGNAGFSYDDQLIGLANGDVAFLSTTTLTVLAGATGTVRWSAPVASALAVAGSSASGVSVAVVDPADSTRSIIERFDVNGVRATDWSISERVNALQYAANDQLVVRSTLGFTTTLTKLRTNGRVVFTVTEATEGTSYPHPMVVGPTGDIITADTITGGMRLRRRSGTTGASTWTIDKPAPGWVTDLAIDPATDRFLVSTKGSAATGPWVEIFGP